MKWVYLGVAVLLFLAVMFGVLIPTLISTKSTVAFLVGVGCLNAICLIVIHSAVWFVRKQMKGEVK